MQVRDRQKCPKAFGLLVTIQQDIGLNVIQSGCNTQCICERNNPIVDVELCSSILNMTGSSFLMVYCTAFRLLAEIYLHVSSRV